MYIISNIGQLYRLCYVKSILLMVNKCVRYHINRKDFSFRKYIKHAKSCNLNLYAIYEQRHQH